MHPSFFQRCTKYPPANVAVLGMKALNELQSLNVLVFLNVQNDLAVILILMRIVYVSLDKSRRETYLHYSYELSDSDKDGFTLKVH